MNILSKIGVVLGMNLLLIGYLTVAKTHDVKKTKDEIYMKIYVTDEYNNPMTGVRLDYNHKTTYSNINGEFKIEYPLDEKAKVEMISFEEKIVNLTECAFGDTIKLK